MQLTVDPYYNSLYNLFAGFQILIEGWDMTIRSERVNAILNTEAFLYQLLDPKKTPKVPLSIRKRAGELLRHYPTELYVNDVLLESRDD